MKAPLVLFTFQQIILEVSGFIFVQFLHSLRKILVSARVIPCDNNISMEMMSSVVMSCLLMIESTVLAVLTAFVYIRSDKPSLLFTLLIDFLDFLSSWDEIQYLKSGQDNYSLIRKINAIIFLISVSWDQTNSCRDQQCHSQLPSMSRQPSVTVSVQQGSASSLKHWAWSWEQPGGSWRQPIQQ